MEIKLKCSDLKLKADYKSLVKNLFDFSLGSVLTDTFKVESTLETKAFELLFNSMKATNLELLQKYGEEVITKHQSLIFPTESLEDEITAFFEQEVVLTDGFFKNVIQHNPAYLSKSYSLFEAFLVKLGVDTPQHFDYEYYMIFRDNLSHEYSYNDGYAELLKKFNNPISEQNSRYDKLLRHYALIREYFVNPLQPDNSDQTETLSDLYVEPFFEFYSANVKLDLDHHEDFVPPPTTITIHDFLKEYYFKDICHESCEKTYNMLFLLGQPGQGKTSFCYKLIYDYLTENTGLPPVPIHFIKIRDLVAKDFIDNTFLTLSKRLNLEANFDEDGFVLVLDGLDEAYMSGGISDRDLSTLYERLNKKTRENPKLKIILTSRLNYLRINDPCLDGSLILQLSEFTDDQIRLYAEKFKVFYPQNKFVAKIETLLDNNEYLHIKELVQQAVLIYFIAILDIDLDQKDSKTIVYDKIFDSLAMRSWDKNGQLDYINPKIKSNPEKYSKYLREYIRSIAFEIHQSPNLYITLEKLIGLESTKVFMAKCFNSDLNNSTDRINEINKYLLISFYFQQSKKHQNSETAIEFFHNSLWEFLTAEYIWEEAKKLLLEKDEDGDIKLVSTESLFDLLNRLIGKKSLSWSLNNNLIEIIATEKLETREVFFNQFENLFAKLLKEGFLLNYSKKESVLKAKDKLKAITQLCWILLHSTNIELKNMLNVSEETFEYVFGGSGIIHLNVVNVAFEQQSFSLEYLGDSTFKNVEIFDCSSGYYSENTFEETTFIGCSFSRDVLTDNIFQNCSFINCSFSPSTVCDRNQFLNVKFDEVYVPNENWLLEMKQMNIFDDFTLANHTIRPVKDFDYNGDKSVRFTVVFIGDTTSS